MFHSVAFVGIISLLVQLYHKYLFQPFDDLSNIKLLHRLREVRDMVTLPICDVQIAVGCNVCLDAVVDAFELFESVGIQVISDSSV